MDLITKLRYQGYASTPTLWKNEALSQFKQIELDLNSEINDDSIVFKNNRLGKLVEEFVFYQLRQQTAITWVADNLQIQNAKQTIGEIDALYYHEEDPIHLEIVYKFYLYDTLENYNEPLAYWIGPNRKDSLLYKLNKLHKKQFPLLYNKVSKTYLDSFNLDAESIKQQLCFKAQLFLPYNKTIDISPLNKDCIAGFYSSHHTFERFKNLKFYIPTKLDWLINPHHNVSWINYSSAKEIIENEIKYKRSPLIWIKHSEMDLTKYFITWW